MLVYEIGEALDISRARVVELEEAMNTIKENLLMNSKRRLVQPNKCIKKNYRKNYIFKKDKLDVEFERRL
jgi:hypothetical protein